MIVVDIPSVEVPRTTARPSTRTISPPGSPTHPLLPRASSRRVEDSRRGSSPETSYASSSPSRSRRSRLPDTFTTSASSTPASWTLVPDSLLVLREVDTVDRAASELGAAADAGVSTGHDVVHDVAAPAVGTDRFERPVDVGVEELVAPRGDREVGVGEHDRRRAGRATAAVGVVAQRVADADGCGEAGDDRGTGDEVANALRSGHRWAWRWDGTPASAVPRDTMAR